MRYPLPSHLYQSYQNVTSELLFSANFLSAVQGSLAYVLDVNRSAELYRLVLSYRVPAGMNISLQVYADENNYVQYYSALRVNTSNGVFSKKMTQILQYPVSVLTDVRYPVTTLPYPRTLDSNGVYYLVSHRWHWYDTMWYCMIWYCMILYDMIWYDVVCVVFCDVMEYFADDISWYRDVIWYGLDHLMGKFHCEIFYSIIVNGLLNLMT